MKSKRIIALTLFFLICVFALLICVFSLIPRFALAKSAYYKVVENDAIFYLDKELKSPLFYLPLGYYVAVEEELDNCYKISYADTNNGYLKITGYAIKSSLLLSTPSTPYFPQTSVKAKSTSILYEDSACKNQKSAIISGQNLLIYGKGMVENCYFVLFGNEFGYVDVKNLESFEIPIHPQDIPSPTIAPLPEVENEYQDAFLQSTIPDSIKYLLIVFLVIPVALFTLFLFSVKKKG